MMEPLQYLRNHAAISAEQQALLAQKKVLIAGCGGLGGYLLENLGRVGVGYLRVVDSDLFEASNLNRQLLGSHMNLSKPKVLAAKQRMQAVNPHITVDALQVRMEQENARDLVAGVDLVVDCLDNIPSRMLLQTVCEEAGLPLVHGAVAGWRGQVCVVMPGQRLLNQLYPFQNLERGEEAQQGTLSFTASFVASLQSSLAITLLLSTIELSKRVLLIDLKEPLFQMVTLR
ncbi:MAG: HesA/MoeB/ThiF family protein [Anaerolineaceae bacterium]|nr:HesA/MoeB/ThiF family protein [Anaerolineaceae bacterium]